MIFGFLLLTCVCLQDAPSFPQNDWISVQPKNAGAEVRMPVKPVHRERSFEAVRDQPVTVNMYSGTTPDKKKSFVFAYHDVFEKIRDKKHEKIILDGAVEGAKGPYIGDLISDQEIMKDLNRGRDFTIIVNQNGNLVKIKQRVLLVGQRLYQLNVVSAKEDFDESEAKQFFDSLKLDKKPDKSKAKVKTSPPRKQDRDNGP